MTQNHLKHIVCSVLTRLLNGVVGSAVRIQAQVHKLQSYGHHLAVKPGVSSLEVELWIWGREIA